MRPHPREFHQFLIEIEELHGHGPLHRGGADNWDFVCRYEDCDESILVSEVLRGAMDRGREKKRLTKERARALNEERKAAKTEEARKRIKEKEDAHRRWVQDQRKLPKKPKPNKPSDVV